MALRYQLGRCYSPQELQCGGFVLSTAQRKLSKLALCLVALPMGSLHAVDFSQDYHEGLVVGDAKIDYDSLLHYGHPISRWCEGPKRLYHGLYIDDSGCVGVVPEHVAEGSTEDVDTVRMDLCESLQTEQYLAQTSKAGA